MFSMLGVYRRRCQGPRRLNSRSIWLQPPPLGLLWSAWNPLVGQRPRGHGTKRRRAEGDRQLFDRRRGREGDQEESECQAGIEAFTPRYPVSVGRQFAPLSSHSTPSGNLSTCCKICFPYSSCRIKIVSPVKQVQKTFSPCYRAVHKSIPCGGNGRLTQTGHPKTNGMTSGTRSRSTARNQHQG